ncbi:MAG TPA: hypothetical protein VLE95_01765 [Chlamydiales bacterium]|nr:hypothetical protein [Chlamydiales bacterium]
MEEIAAIDTAASEFTRFVAGNSQTHMSNPSDKINFIAPGIIAGAETPRGARQIEAKRLSPPSIHAISVAEGAIENPEITTPKRSADFACRSIEAVKAFEAFLSRELQKLSNQIKGHLQNIDHLLEPGTESTALPEKDLIDKIRNLIAELDNCNMKVRPSNLLSEKNLSELKEQIGAHIDELRTTTIGTEIQSVINDLQAIMDSIEQIIQLVFHSFHCL